MSAQGATLGGRGNALHLPIWPVAVTRRRHRCGADRGHDDRGADPRRQSAVPVDRHAAANSTTAIREAGVVLPVAFGISHVTPEVENPAAYAPQGRLREGLENPAAYAPQAPTYAPGLENPGAYPSEAGPVTNPCPVTCKNALP